MSRSPACRAGTLLAPLLLLGCQQPDPSGAGPSDANLAKNSFLLRLSNPGDMSAQMGVLRGELARRGIVIRREYGDAVGLLGTVNVRATADQIQGLLREAPMGQSGIEAHADVLRYLLDDTCGDGTCASTEKASPSRPTTTCSTDCGVPASPEQQAELTNSWQVGTLHADQAWAQTQGEGIDVAVFDTGYDRGPNSTHPDKPAHLGYSYSFASESPDFSDIDQHGTHVVGIVAAARNGYGAVGVAPGVTMHMYQVFHSEAGRVVASNSDLIAATESAIRNNYHIISMSLGGPGDSELEHQAVRKAYDSGLLVVVASGNAESYDTGAILTAPHNFPGAYPESMSIGATDRADHITDFSSQGSTVTVSAPGLDVYSSVPQRKLQDGSVVGGGDREVSAVFTIDGAKKTLASAAPTGGSDTALSDQPLVSCGFGMTAEVLACAPAGKVALIQRGPFGAMAIPFSEKLANARSQGAIGVILYNHRGGDPTTAGGLLQSIGLGTSQPVPVATLAAGDGENLKGLLAAGKKITLSLSFNYSDYSVFSGTSMATPATAGIAALVWSRNRNLTNVQLRQLLAESAVDLGPPGRDDAFGWGRVDAMRALSQAAPRGRCGDGTLDRASEICDGKLVANLTCEDFGWDLVAGVQLGCNNRCTSPDPKGCTCAGSAPFEVSETVQSNQSQQGLTGTLATYHVQLGGKPVRGAMVHVTVTGPQPFDYTLGPSDSNGDIADFTPYTGTMMTAGTYVFSPVITKASGRCHPDTPMTPPTYTIVIKS